MPKLKDDPVYNQPEGSSASSSTPSSVSKSGSDAVADDPTYNQPQPQSQSKVGISDNDKDNNTGTRKSAETDSHGSESSQRPRHQDGTGAVTEDPVYDQTQSQTKNNGVQQSGSNNTSTDTDTNTPSTNARAKSRLDQLNSQLTPSAPSEPPASPSQSNTKRPRTRKAKSRPKDPQAGLPNDYSDITDSIAKMHHHAQHPPSTHRGYTRQLQSGKLTARQRIATLLNPGTFREVGSVTGTTSWSTDPENPLIERVEDFTPSNNPQGFGQITCLRTGGETVTRQVYLTADDFAIRGGHADGHNGLKTLYGERLALKLKVPVVKLTDGSSGGGSVSTIAKQGWSYVPYLSVLVPVVKQLNEGIPNLGAVVGPAIGLGAARVVSTHFSVMAADIGSLFNAGPKVVEGATFEEGLSFSELGGPGVHCCNGTIDNMAKDEKGCYEQIRTVLGYLPDCGALQAPPCLPENWSGDSVQREDESLRSVIPRRKNRMYNPFTIIESVVDRGSWFEIGGLWGRTAIVGLARLGGRPVGILSNNCEINGGALDAAGSQKLLKMIKFADVFNLPIVQFVDIREYHLFNHRSWSVC